MKKVLIFLIMFLMVTSSHAGPAKFCKFKEREKQIFCLDEQIKALEAQIEILKYTPNKHPILRRCKFRDSRKSLECFREYYDRAAKALKENVPADKRRIAANCIAKWPEDEPKEKRCKKDQHTAAQQMGQFVGQQTKGEIESELLIWCARQGERLGVDYVKTLACMKREVRIRRALAK